MLPNENLASEVRDFYEYILARVDHGMIADSLDECVADFHVYQAELSKCRAEIRAALETQAASSQSRRKRVKSPQASKGKRTGT